MGVEWLASLRAMTSRLSLLPALLGLLSLACSTAPVPWRGGSPLVDGEWTKLSGCSGPGGANLVLGENDTLHQRRLITCSDNHPAPGQRAGPWLGLADGEGHILIQPTTTFLAPLSATTAVIQRADGVLLLLEHGTGATRRFPGGSVQTYAFGNGGWLVFAVSGSGADEHWDLLALDGSVRRTFWSVPPATTWPSVPGERIVLNAALEKGGQVEGLHLDITGQLIDRSPPLHPVVRGKRTFSPMGAQPFAGLGQRHVELDAHLSPLPLPAGSTGWLLLGWPVAVEEPLLLREAEGRPFFETVPRGPNGGAPRRFDDASTRLGVPNGGDLTFWHQLGGEWVAVNERGEQVGAAHAPTVDALRAQIGASRLQEQQRAAARKVEETRLAQERAERQRRELEEARLADERAYLKGLEPGGPGLRTCEPGEVAELCRRYGHKTCQLAQDRLRDCRYGEAMHQKRMAEAREQSEIIDRGPAGTTKQLKVLENGRMRTITVPGWYRP